MINAYSYIFKVYKSPGKKADGDIFLSSVRPLKLSLLKKKLFDTAMNHVNEILKFIR